MEEGRVGRLNVFVLILLIGIFGLGFVSGSTQSYDIEINVNENINSTSGEVLLSVDAPEGIVENLIIFNVEVDYIGSANCLLQIDNGNLLGEGSWSINLTSGQRNWDIECSDGNIINSTSGSFNVFDFSMSTLDEFYFNNSIISGNVESQGNFELKLKQGTNIQVVSNSNGAFSIEGALISAPGEYELVATTDYYGEKISTSRNFSVGYVSTQFNDENSEPGENVEIKVIVDSQGFAGNYILRSGSVLIDADAFSGASLIDVDVDNFAPDNNGDYSLELTVNINGKNYNFAGLNILTVASPETDNTDVGNPEVDLKYPAWEETVRTSTIEFTYEVKDNVDVSTCNLKLYNATRNSAGIYETDGLIFPLSSADNTLALENNLDKIDEVGLKLVDFDAGDYIWEVKCEDSAGNSGWDFNYFRVDLTGGNYSSNNVGTDSYEREDEVKNLINGINSFLEKQDILGIEERRVIEILGLEADMNFYKKQLIQMDQDLRFNLRFMTDDKKVNRIKEINDEIDEIKEGVILDVSVTDSYEYSKNSIDVLIEDIISKYFKANDHNVKAGTLRSIIKFNEELQKKLNVRVEAWKLKLEYLDEDRNMILVNKKLDFDTGSDEKLLEIIDGDSLEDITFVSEAKSIGEGIWEIDLEELEEDELVYYFYGDFALQKIEKTESIIFSEEGSADNNMITGFVVGIEDGLNFSFFSFLIGFLFLGYVGFFVFGKVKLETWKKDPNVIRILDLIAHTKLLLREDNVERARDNYRKMGDVYKILPNKCKTFFYNEIKMVRLAIDKKDILNLVKEYERAKQEFRKDDAIQLHSRINDIYKKLPKKFQDKVYQRLVKNEFKS